MIKKAIVLLLAVFLVGWISGSVYSNHFCDEGPENHGKAAEEDNKEILNENKIGDKSDDKTDVEGVFDPEKEFERIQELFANEEKERDKISPYDWIKKEQIFVYDSYVMIKIQNPEWSIFTDTKSMDPVIDSSSNAIEIVPKSEKDVHLGDIVAYESKYKKGVVTHRVVEIGSDKEGWYASLKGDNNDKVDPGKIRFDQIKRIVVAVIY